MSHHPRSRSSGAALILLTLMLAIVLIPLVGLAVDGSIMYMLKLRFVAAADAAALAGARSLSVGMTLDSQKAAAEATAIRFFQANFPYNYWNCRYTTSGPGADVTAVAAETGLKTRTVTVQGTIHAPTYFLHIIGRQTQDIFGQAKSSRRDVNLELVLDRSTSMGGAMSSMLSAARTFTSQFAEGRDNLGLIVFGGAAVQAFPAPPASTGPASNFKSASPNMDTLISQTNNGGNTGTAQAIHMAYDQLQKKNQPGALNLIVLFTDGLPNGVVADFNDATKDKTGKLTNNYLIVGKCTHRGDPAWPMLGFMSQTSNFAPTGNTNGVKHIDTSTVGSANEGPLGAHTSDGCSYQANETRIRQDLSRLPDNDYYGNQLSGPYKTVDLAAAVTSPQAFGKAAMNAADNQVQTIRKDTSGLKVVIYAIGYEGGSEKPDEVWMQRIANDPISPDYDKTYPAGLYVKAPTVDQIMAAFNRVASEIMRLSI